MMWFVVSFAVWLNLFANIHGTDPENVTDWTISFNGARVPTPELDLCRGFKVPQAGFIFEFDINADTSVVHHVLIFGCSAPSFEDQIYDCTDMFNPTPAEPIVNGYPAGPICKGTPSVLYSWAQGTPFQIPAGIGFGVGGSSGHDYVILQIHYAPRPQEGTDNSNVTLRMVAEGNPYIKHRGGVFTSVKEMTGGIIPAGKITNIDMVCPMPKSRTAINSIALRVHTHGLGYSVSLYVVRRNKWTLIGRLDPQAMQLFIPLEKEITIQPGDIFASRCVMNNTRSTDVTMGYTKANEMCLTYLMYYNDNLYEHLDQMDGCFSSMNVTWENNFCVPEEVEMATKLPGTNQGEGEMDMDM